MKTKMILSALLAATLLTEAVELTRDGDWNLVSMCQEMQVSDMNMSNIEEIQTQDGLTAYTGIWQKYSTLRTVPAGYGLWVKGKAGTEFKIGEDRRKILKPLKRDDITLMASCQERDASVMNMKDLEEIQNQDGKTLFKGEWASRSTLPKILKGPGYWVKGHSGVVFDVKDTFTVPSEFNYQAINNLNQPVEVAYENYTIKLFSEHNQTADSQLNHTGIVVKIDGHDAPVMHIQESYQGQEIVVGIYNSDDKLVGITNNIVAESTGPGTIIEMTIEDTASEVNVAPTILGTPESNATVGVEYSFTPTANDSNGDNLIFSIDTKPSWLSFDSTTGRLKGIPQEGDVGRSSAMTISVSDAEETSSLSPFTVEVKEAACIEELTDTHASFNVAKDNAVSDVSKPFNGFQVTVTVNETVTATSTSTNAVYGLINGANTQALLKVNTNYPDGTLLLVKVYKEGKLVGMSDEKVMGMGSLNFGSITTLSCAE